ncbi:MAG: hypothetical protein OXE75_13875 [bacterium]|nr:hypothetical protein [bacterium]
MRTMILLPDHHHAGAKRKAANEGISLSRHLRPGDPALGHRALRVHLPRLPDGDRQVDSG